MVRKGRITAHPRPGDLGMYGPFNATHHVELYCGAPGQEFIGHGSPPIDSRTPGRRDFYLTYMPDEQHPDDQQQPDLTGEMEREFEAATGGIVARPAVLDLDTADDDPTPPASPATGATATTTRSTTPKTAAVARPPALVWTPSAESTPSARASPITTPARRPVRSTG
jgi:hypothetical protein